MENSYGDLKFIRIFICSTFMDCKKERDYLLNVTFKKLNKEFHQYGIIIEPIDLRENLKRKNKKTGQELRNCLSEVDKCRPFFIGIIGDRYGTIPQRREIDYLDLELNKSYKDPIKRILKEKYSFIESEIMYKCLYKKEEKKENGEHDDTLILFRNSTGILDKFKICFFMIFEYHKFKMLKNLKKKILDESYNNQNYIYSSFEEFDELVYWKLERLIKKYCSIKSE